MPTKKALPKQQLSTIHLFMGVGVILILFLAYWNLSNYGFFRSKNDYSQVADYSNRALPTDDAKPTVRTPILTVTPYPTYAKNTGKTVQDKKTSKIQDGYIDCQGNNLGVLSAYGAATVDQLYQNGELVCAATTVKAGKLVIGYAAVGNEWAIPEFTVKNGENTFFCGPSTQYGKSYLACDWNRTVVTGTSQYEFWVASLQVPVTSYNLDKQKLETFIKQIQPGKY